MIFASWAPQALITTHNEQPDPLVKGALLRLGYQEGVEECWEKFPDVDRAVALLKTAAIFYWQSQNLDKPSDYADDMKAMRKHIEELQALMKRAFGVADEKLYKDLENYKSRLNEHAYKAFYARPRQQLLWMLYRLTNEFYGEPRHNMVAYLASSISDETLSKEDVQPTFRLLKGRKSI